MTDTKNKAPGSEEDYRAALKSRDSAKKQLQEAQKTIDDLKEKIGELSDFRTEVEEEREARERQRMEEKGEYDKLSAKQREEIARLKKDNEQVKAEADRRLSDALIPTKIAAMIAKYERPIYGEADVIELIKGKFKLDSDGNLASEHGEPTEILDSFLKDRPQLLGLEKKGDLKIKTSDPTKKDWDIEKAMNDPAYADEWRESDSEGYDKAVDAAMSA